MPSGDANKTRSAQKQIQARNSSITVDSSTHETRISSAEWRVKKLVYGVSSSFSVGGDAMAGVTYFENVEKFENGVDGR